MQKPLKVNLIVPNNVNVTELVSSAVRNAQITEVKRILDKTCETSEQRNRLIDAVQARFI